MAGFDRSGASAAASGLGNATLRRFARGQDNGRNRRVFGENGTLRQVIEQHLGFFPDHAVAFAAHALERCTIQHLDQTALIGNHSELLQFRRSPGDPLAAYAEHVSHEFLGHRQVIVREAIHRQQQPPAKLLVDGVMPIADRGLRNLCDQRLRVAQHQNKELPVAAELRPDSRSGEAIGITGALHQGSARGAFAAHQKGDAEQTLIANHEDRSR